MLYHHVAENKTDHRYYVSPLLFAEQMQWLTDHGYQAITEATLAEVIRHGGKLPARPVIITFDDGNGDFFTTAYPVMSKQHLVGVAFLITNRIDKPKFLSGDQVTELINAGWEIGSHTITHPDMVRHRVDLDREIVGSKEWLDQKFGINVVSFAYPYGLSNALIIQFVTDHGYTSAARLGAQTHQSEKNLYDLSRTEIWGSFDMQQFAALMPWQ